MRDHGSGGENAVTHKSTVQLGAIDEISRLGVEVWLRGGWAVDFFLGEITREHVDIDWFAWIDDVAELTDGLLRLGFTPITGPPEDQQRDFVRDGVEISVALLARDDAGRVVVAGGPWKGQPWPDGMLAGTTGRIGDVTCPIISPEAQIEIKLMMPEWVPSRPRREKDQADIERLRRALTGRQ